MTPRIILFITSGSKKKEPGCNVCVKPKLHVHKEFWPRFLPLFHIPYTVDCLTALLGEDFSSGYYVQ